MSQGKTAIRNVYNWRVKETERMKAIVTELGKLGAEVSWGQVKWVCGKWELLKAWWWHMFLPWSIGRQPFFV